jgi:hypothetical protein
MALLETRKLNKRFGGLQVTADWRASLPDRSERRR